MNIIKDISNREILSILFSKVIIIEATIQYHDMSIEYTALCESFDEVSDGMFPPYYSVVVKDSNIILFERKNNGLMPIFKKEKNPIEKRLESI
jgi:hypothetical protein